MCFLRSSNWSMFLVKTYHVSHEEVASTIAHAQTPLHEGHNSVEGVHVSPVQVVLKKEIKDGVLRSMSTMISVGWFWQIYIESIEDWFHWNKKKTYVVVAAWAVTSEAPVVHVVLWKKKDMLHCEKKTNEKKRLLGQVIYSVLLCWAWLCFTAYQPVYFI